MLCGVAPDFLVYRWWSARFVGKPEAARVLVRDCVPPDDGIGSVTFSPDGDGTEGLTTLPWRAFFTTFEPSGDHRPCPPFMHDPIFRERSGAEAAKRADVVTHANRAALHSPDTARMDPPSVTNHAAGV